MLLPEGFHPLPGEALPAAISRSVRVSGAAIWQQTADLLNARASHLRRLGIGVAYHNHNLEFAPLGRATGWEILRGETDPALVSFEVDIGWVAAAGLAPLAFPGSIGGRVSHVHVKDIGADNPTNYAIAIAPTEVV